MKNSKQDKRPKRQSKVPSFETDPETQVERSIRYEHRNTAFIFIHEKACVTTTLSNRAWPRGYSDEAKLALRPGQYEFITHNSAPHRMMYLGRASIERAREHKKLLSEVYVKGQRPPFIWEGPGTENATIVTSQTTVSATQPANVFVPESPDMLFLLNRSTKLQAEIQANNWQLTAKTLLKHLSKWMQQHSHFYSKRVQQHQQQMPVYRYSQSVWKSIWFYCFLIGVFWFRVPLLCVASSKSFWKATRKKCVELLKFELLSKRNTTKSEGSY